MEAIWVRPPSCRASGPQQTAARLSRSQCLARREGRRPHRGDRREDAPGRAHRLEGHVARDVRGVGGYVQRGDQAGAQTGCHFVPPGPRGRALRTGAATSGADEFLVPRGYRQRRRAGERDGDPWRARPAPRRRGARVDSRCGPGRPGCASRASPPGARARRRHRIRVGRMESARKDREHLHQRPVRGALPVHDGRGDLVPAVETPEATQHARHLRGRVVRCVHRNPGRPRRGHPRPGRRRHRRGNLSHESEGATQPRGDRGPGSIT